MAKATIKLLVAGMLAAVSAMGAAAEKIRVCVGGEAPPVTVARAEATASWMLATAGLAVEWHSKEAAGRRGESQTNKVVVDLIAKSAESEHPGALAYVLSHQGSLIVVMYDRVERAAGQSSRVGNVLGHVMTHELGHLLQGIARHSEAGVMKAHWDARDIDLMTYGPLAFTAEDIALIHTGIVKRASIGTGLAPGVAEDLR